MVVADGFGEIGAEFGFLSQEEAVDGPGVFLEELGALQDSLEGGRVCGPEAAELDLGEVGVVEWATVCVFETKAGGKAAEGLAFGEEALECEVDEGLFGGAYEVEGNHPCGGDGTGGVLGEGDGDGVGVCVPGAIDGEVPKALEVF